MPKAKLANRLDQLFSDFASQRLASAGQDEATPCEELPVVPGIDSADAFAGLVNAEGTISAEKDLPAPEAPPPSPPPAAREDGRLPGRINANLAGWGDFLDGVRRRESIGYLYESSELKELDTETPVDVEQGDLKYPLRISGHEIGRLLLKSQPDQQWTEEDRELLDAVTVLLAQQVETLRLLDESQRSHVQAEQALFRLAKQSGRETLQPVNTGMLGASRVYMPEINLPAFVYDQSEVKADPALRLRLQRAPEIGETTLQVPLKAGERLLGAVRVETGEPVSDQDIGLVQAVVNRLSQQVENLRLLEESRHFRSETETAIRAITHQNWQSYLDGVSRAQVGYQYGDNRIRPLDPALPVMGQVFPLRVHGEAIGELAVDAELTRSEEVQSLLDTVGDRLSLHLDGLRLAEQREQALSETEMLYTISARLSTAQSLEEALTSVSQPAAQSGASDSRLFFFNYDERSQVESLTLAAVWYPDEGAQIVPVITNFQLADYPVYRLCLADSENPLLVEDIRSDPRFDDAARELLMKTGARAAAMLPLAINRRWVGTIFLHWREPHAFSAQEKRLYTTLSRQAAVVVNNRLLLEQTRKRAQELQTVAQVSTAASTILNPHELLQSVVDLTKSSFSLYHVQVYLYRPGDRILEVAAGSGEVGHLITAQRQYEVFESLSPVSRAARERQVVIINDTASSPVAKRNMLLPEVRSEIAIPMVAGDRMMGVFDVLSDGINRFTREDARTFSTLASQVAVALQNAELYAEQTATVERLRELDHLKSSFLANMSHELRTPLNSILGFAEVLLLGLDGPLNEVMDNDVRLIEKNGKHLLSLINDVLDMAKIEAGRMSLSFDHFTLRELLEETIDITGSLAREKGLYLKIGAESQDRIEMIADRVRIRQVLINVISNAVKFTETGGVTLSAEPIGGGMVRIAIQDTGLGIPPTKLEMIFEEFSQVDTSTTRKVGGTGLGLPISRRLVELHGGHLWAESTGVAGEGSKFIIEIPIESTRAAGL